MLQLQMTRRLQAIHKYVLFVPIICSFIIITPQATSRYSLWMRSMRPSRLPKLPKTNFKGEADRDSPYLVQLLVYTTLIIAERYLVTTDIHQTGLLQVQGVHRSLIQLRQVPIWKCHRTP